MLGISNLSWENNKELENIIPILKDNNISYIEIILPKYLTWGKNDFNMLDEFINIIQKHNFKLNSTQSIFFNTNVKSFNDISFINHIEVVSNICKYINVEKIVLGSPSIRTERNYDVLSNTFKYVDEIISNNNQILLLEPNSKIYNGKFFHTVKEIVEFILLNNFSNIHTMIDTHNILLENENLISIFTQYKDYIKHIHVSEVNLGDFIESNNHIDLSNILKHYNYDGLIIYETKPSLNLQESIKSFSKIYNN
jgi:sugar phosphate isomerase/epimerase